MIPTDDIDTVTGWHWICSPPVSGFLWCVNEREGGWACFYILWGANIGARVGVRHSVVMDEVRLGCAVENALCQLVSPTGVSETSVCEHCTLSIWGGSRKLHHLFNWKLICFYYQSLSHSSRGWFNKANSTQSYHTLIIFCLCVRYVIVP